MDRKTHIHLPLTDTGRKVKIPTDLPVLFLAGPIRNAPKWQSAAIHQLIEQNHSIFVASPTRELDPELMLLTEKDAGEYETFERQRAWEQYYLYAAAEHGVIVFWLPKEIQPKEVADKVYAHITMLELGEWIARAKINPGIHIVIGTDGEFPEWSTIEYEIQTELQNIQIGSSLKETITLALQKILTNYP